MQIFYFIPFICYCNGGLFWLLFVFPLHDQATFHVRREKNTVAVAIILCLTERHSDSCN